MLKIRATNPDNSADARSLVELFTSCYGQSYPLSSVYDAEYWASKAGTAFLSAVVVDKQKVLAHLGVCTDSQYQGDAHICYLAVSAELGVDTVLYLNSMWEFLCKSSDRQNWKQVLCPVFEGQQQHAIFADQVLQAQATAVIPEYFKGADSNFRAIGITVSKLGSSGIELAKVRIPAKYQSYFADALTSLGVNSKFETDRKGPRAISADAQGVLRYNYRGWGTEHLFITPALLTNWDQLASPSGQRQVIFIDIRDPACPDWCLKAEENGFVFAGVLPFMCARHSIVFCQKIESPAVEHRLPFERLQTVLNWQLLAAKDRDSAGIGGKVVNS